MSVSIESGGSKTTIILPFLWNYVPEVPLLTSLYYYVEEGDLRNFVKLSVLTQLHHIRMKISLSPCLVRLFSD